MWRTSKLILLESVSTDIYKVPYFETSLQRIFNTHFKNCHLLFSAVISEHFSKNRMIIAVMAAKIWYLKNVRFLLGHPVNLLYFRTLNNFKRQQKEKCITNNLAHCVAHF